MPKIRQAIAAVIAAAFCIGFNTYRYPAVWDMVAAAPQPSKPAGSSAVAATSAASKERDYNSLSEPSANSHGNGVCKDGVCTMTYPDTPLANMPGSMPNSDSGEAEPAADSSSDAESKSKDSDSPSASNDSEGGYNAKGPKTEDPSTTPEWGSKPKDAERESMSMGPESGFMPKGPGAEYSATTPDSYSKPKEAQSADNPKQTESLPNANYGGLRPDGENPRAEPAKTESYPFLSGAGDSGPAYEKKAERKPAAHLVSESTVGNSPSDETQDRPLPTEALVPIKRPRSRARDAASAMATRGPGSLSPDSEAFNSTTDREPDSHKTRHLPPVDAATGSDAADPPPMITPELMRGYRVTAGS